MVNKHKDKDDIDLEVTNEASEQDDIEIEDIEEKGGDKLKQLREKLAQCEADKRQAMEGLQRAKAEFLNVRKRLEDERHADRERATLQHAEALLLLCDSFEMAMRDEDVWKKADESWRKGIEGIHMQLQKLLQSYNVTKIEAAGATFDPHRMEALDTIAVANKEEVDVVQQVLQTGYEMKVNDKIEVIRPARVVTGTIAITKD